MASDGPDSPGQRLPQPSRAPFPGLPDKSHIPEIQAKPNTKEVFKSVIDGRQHWKASRGGELVWPPELEGALIEGLERYEPQESRETRYLGRYPMRNRFISDYIFEKTGVRRTAKQVSSRLQQIRDVGTGRRLMGLLAPCGPPVVPLHRSPSPCPSYHSDSGSSSDTSSAPTTPIDSAFPKLSDKGKGKATRTVIYIDVLPPPTALKRLARALQQSTSHPDDLPPQDYVFRPTINPRPFRSIDPTVTFVGPQDLDAHSSYIVTIRGVEVFRESKPLVPLGPVPGMTDGSRLYTTQLIPGFWDRISESPDPEQYCIFQEVTREGPSSPSSSYPSSPSSSSSSSSSLIFSAVYRFIYPRKLPCILPPIE